MRLLQSFVHRSRECGYLPDRGSALDTRMLLDVTPSELEAMLSRGWRRFGPSYFRPRCAACNECVGIRIPVAAWSPSRSQRRVAQRNADLLVEMREPVIDRERLDLYARWHEGRERARGWEPSALDPDSYEMQFAFPHPSATELSYRLRDASGRLRLIALGLCDRTPNALSAVYCFYDPAQAPRSLGVFNVLTHLAIARSLGLSHVYLGYRVAPCRSMAYKARFRPHELLEDRPGDEQPPAWRRVDPDREMTAE
jgi:arginyl-tRNA--protein-N-Asp/Glu arginylyltransferase